MITMKSKEVLNILGISRITLYRYVKNGKIKVTKLQNGYYDYDKISVYKLLKKDIRFNVIYARVSTYKQKTDLGRQIKIVKKYCEDNKLKFNKIYSDISSGIDLDRPAFKILLDEIINYKINTIYISHKDWLTRLSFTIIDSIFQKFGTNIVVINDSKPDDDTELFKELI